MVRGATHSKGIDCHESRLRTSATAGLDVTGGKRLGDQVRFVPRVELVAEILDVTLDGAGGDAELLCALLGRQPLGDALQNFALAIRQRNEIGSLTGRIHD